MAGLGPSRQERRSFPPSSLQGLLALEGELTPILVQMVKSANMNGLLDSDSDSLTDCQQRVKARLHEIMQKDLEFTQDDYQKVCGQAAPVCPGPSRPSRTLTTLRPVPAGSHRQPVAGQLHGAHPEPGPNLPQGARSDPEPDLADPQTAGGPKVGR